jgi:dienelactone hydrolase
VPLPADASIAAPIASSSTFQQRWSGVWVGAWDGKIRHILLVESVGEDGAARVVYAMGDNPSIPRSWRRLEAIVSERMLKVINARFSATYDMTEDGGLAAEFKLGRITSRARMTKADFASLRRSDAAVAWTRGKSELLQTDLIEDDKPVRLEVVIFKPRGAGPFPLAVLNHGSTGYGRNPALFTETRVATDLADFLNERGWMVAFPHRRGRGKSDGRYDEGFSENRTSGYTCDTDTTLRGAARALSDIESAITALRSRQDVAPTPILIGGMSRGGILSVAYAGGNPAQVFGVINFVGGWLGEGCQTAGAVNKNLFVRGSTYPRPIIWLYGRGDTYYSIAHSRENFSAFETAGGKGEFYEFDMPPLQGHSVFNRPELWSGPIDRYLKSVDMKH